MAACQDNDKVHVHGIRALGYLLAIKLLPCNHAQGWWGKAWLPQATQCLQTSLASRVEKVMLHAALEIEANLKP